MLIIPGESIESIVPKVSDKHFEKELEVDDFVQVFNKEHYGKTGKVKALNKDSVVVVIDNNSIEINPYVLGVLA